jgi:hypothetical protein
MQLSGRVGAHAATLIAVAGSVALSLVAIARTPIVNNDGSRYLAAADAYAASGRDAAQRIYPWPFYSGLVSLAIPLTGSARAAAHALDTVLLAVASAAFVLIVRELGAERPTQMLAAALVLTHPGLTEVRAVIVRDFGLWAFGLLGLLALLKFARSGAWSAAAVWTGCGAAAMLFRPEAAVVWAVSALSPLLDPTRPLRARCVRFSKLNAFAAAAVLTAIVVFAVEPAAWSWTIDQFAFLARPTAARFESAARALAEAFPYRHGREYAPYILFWGLSAIPAVKVVRAMGLAQAGLAGAGAASGPGAPHLRRALWLTIVGAGVPLLVLLPYRLFIETRYTILCSLLLMVFAPFPLARLARSPGTVPRLLTALLAGTIVFTCCWELISVPEPPWHLRAAGEWLRENTPPDARIHTNSPQIAYYSRRRVDWDEVESLLLGAPLRTAAGSTDFFAVVTPTPEERRKEAAGGAVALAPLVSFPGRHGDDVIIYRAAAPEGPAAPAPP